MDYITKPSITRLARKAGVKSLSDECYSHIRQLVSDNIEKIISVSLVVNSEHNTKTLMVDDIHQALRLCGYNVSYSNDLGKNNCLSKLKNKKDSSKNSEENIEEPEDPEENETRVQIKSRNKTKKKISVGKRKKE